MAISIYKRRQPELTGLWQTVHRHWSTFEAQARAKGAPPPRFVERAFHKYLRCGILAHGFARVRCTSCGDDRLVAFSCKVRGLCPSCDGRRMVDTAAHLIDHVYPTVPFRQYVVTVPHWLRFKIAWDRKLFSVVHRTMMQALRAWMRARARRCGIRDAEVGATAHTHRFGDGLRMNPHVHFLYADGVWHQPDDAAPPQFAHLPKPTDADIADLARMLHHKIIAKLMRQGAIGQDDAAGELFALEQPLLAKCTTASMLDRVAIGERAGQLVWRVRTEPPEQKSSSHLCATFEGFCVHARTTVPALAR
ncbi:MAG: transposase zinc-binding domain-containing protein, partial [Myxococcales bacterium]|nr:transposase zinc-binding domain-containing protein [Myxococcales bacterium]